MVRSGSRSSKLWRALGCAAALAFASAPAAAHAGKSSLYQGPAPRPGPPLLYQKPPTAPQLHNRGPWRAKPLLVSGASAYRRGEFVYQDFLYDDHGARGGLRDPDDPRTGNDSFSQPNGTYTYPTDPKYRNNVADLVELRVKPRRRATLFRLTFNSMTRPGLVATTIALGDSEQARELPFGANASAPARRFLVVRGRSARLVRARDGELVEPRSRATVSRRRKQISVRVPRRAWNPGNREVRMAAATGLWDAGAGAYMTPADTATESRAGGAGTLGDPTALFNVAFRFDEPFPKPDADGAFANPAWWRDKAQGTALAANDLSPFSARVDFGKLRRKVRDDMRGEPGGIPRAGPMNRILSSRFSDGQGADHSADCGGADGCTGQYVGRLQPYSIYVPRKPAPRRGYGLTLLMHSLGANHNQYLGTRNQSQFGERAKGSIVISGLSRGPDGWYYGKAGADVFEVWADVARRFRLDPARAAAAGYSMGGYGTYKLTAQFPDLFAAGQPTVGPPGLGTWLPPTSPSGGESTLTTRMLPSLRHVPFLIWNGVGDELVPVTGPLAHVERFDELGLRYTFDLFTNADHFALASNDQYRPAADFLGDRRVRRNPAHVTYVRNPSMDFSSVGTEANSAYWLSGIHLRDGSDEEALGTVDAFSHAFGKGDPPVNPTQRSAGTLTGGNLGPFAFVRQSRSWGRAPSIPRRDRLDLDLSNLERVRVHVRRARLSCSPELNVTTDGPVTVRLVGCGRTRDFDG